MKTIILCKKLFTAETDFAQENMAVILEDNKIADVYVLQLRTEDLPACHT